MKKTILLVDDSRMALEMVRFMLAGAGYNVLTAQGGNEALEIMGQNEIDLSVVDINMTVMDGYTLIAEIRADDRFADIPLVIATTEAEAQDKQKGFDAGADAYLTKPLEQEELVAQVKLLIG